MSTSSGSLKYHLDRIHRKLSPASAAYNERSKLQNDTFSGKANVATDDFDYQTSSPQENRGLCDGEAISDHKAAKLRRYSGMWSQICFLLEHCFLYAVFLRYFCCTGVMSYLVYLSWHCLSYIIEVMHQCYFLNFSCETNSLITSKRLRERLVKTLCCFNITMPLSTKPRP